MNALDVTVLALALLLAIGPALAQSSAPLADAAEQKDRAKIDALLKKGVDVNAAQVDGTTALHCGQVVKFNGLIAR